MKGIIEKGKYWVKVVVNQEIYPLSTIYSAGYVFLDRAYIHLDKDKGKIVVQLFPKNKKCNLEKLGMDFYNELLNYAHYFSRVKNNSGIIKMIMQRALFSTNPSLIAQTQEKDIENLINELEKKNGKKEKVPATKKRK